MGNGGCGQFITLCLCRSFLITLCLCSSVGSLPREAVLHKLLQHESFPWAAVLHKLLQCGSLPQGAVFQEQAAPVWVPLWVTSSASKPTPAWAPVSMEPQVLAGACSSADFPPGHSLLQTSTCSSVGSPWASGGDLLHRGPPWTAGHSLPHQGLLQGLQGNLWSLEHLLPILLH